MSPVIDQAVTWRKVEERLGVETDPVLPQIEITGPSISDLSVAVSYPPYR